MINTGDNLSDPEGVPEVLDALGPLMEFPGAYVFGSNDYYGPRLRNPGRYLIEKLQGRHGLNGNEPVTGAVHNPWEPMRDAFDEAGWLNLTNTRGTLKIDGHTIGLTGLDDPHIKRDRYARVVGGPAASDDFSLAVVHAPYLRTLDAFTSDGYPLILVATPTAASSASPSTAPSSPTATWTPTASRASPPTPRTAAPPTSTSPRLRHQPLHPGPLRLPPEATLLTLTERETHT
ncbi:hypothetical protein ACFQVA_18665 [Actinomadura keratinilytica]